MKHEKRLDPVMAIYSEDDTSLRFYNYDETAVEGGTYNNLTVSKLYTELEYTNFIYEYADMGEGIFLAFPTTYWYDFKDNIATVVVEDDIIVNNLDLWFYSLNKVNYMDLSKLNTSQVKSMENLFVSVGRSSESLQIVGLNNWDVSNVMNMSGIFSSIGCDLDACNFNDIIGDISSWNTSKVTDMSGMFAGVNAGSSGMHMFYYIGTDYQEFNLNFIENWNVSKVLYYENFNDGVETKVIAPTWVN